MEWKCATRHSARDPVGFSLFGGDEEVYLETISVTSGDRGLFIKARGLTTLLIHTYGPSFCIKFLSPMPSSPFLDTKGQ
jgi:hypothetical protein